MAKTPVSALQEGLMKSGNSLPVYTEVSSKMGEQQIEFVICVTWKKYKEKGIGTSKKEAKQNAAQAMINLLTSLNILHSSSLKLPTEQKNLGHNLQSSTNLSDSLSSLPTSSQDIFTNYVGTLMEYCVRNRMPEPYFDVVAASGQSHNLTFTMSCTIGTVCKKASAASKKAAKQNVAKEILQHFNVDTSFNSTHILEKSEIDIQFKNLQLDTPVLSKEKNQVIENIYNKFKNKPATSAKQIMVKEYHIALANMYRNTIKFKIPDLKSMYETMEYCTKNVTDIKSIIEDSLNVSIKMINIKSQKYDQCIVGLRVTTSPSVVQIGIGKTFEQAEKLALQKLLRYIILLEK
ncbi:protein Loquacious-like [Lasioglossum baleicum]|uniref:protein Loquacious-like n=1 Tax=Lasioglossum baleicum TaxID=434251 RepID=UPI003FCD9C87